MISVQKKSIVLLSALLCAGAVIGETFIDFAVEEEVKKWQIERGGIEVHPSGVRFRVDAGAKSNYGVLRKRVKVPKTGGYVQLEQPNIEDAFARPYLTDQSKNGRALGPVNRGLNTFDVSYRKGQSFALTIQQTGARDRKSVGPWADYRYIRITDCPKGAVLASIRGKKPGEALAVGDTLDFVYYPGKEIREVKAEIVIVPGFIPYFSADLKADPQGVLRGSYTIPAKLPGFSSTSKFFLAARSEAEGIVSTSVFGFPVKIEGKEKLDLGGSFIPATPTIRKARGEWAKLTKGTNLARGKKVSLVPKANYFLTCDGHDETDLTDGKLSIRSDDRIWFDKHAVGWRSNLVCMKLDLGEVKPVGRTVVRMLSGANRINPAPSSFEVFVSRDGENWFPASELKKLAPGEKDQADWKSTFYLDEATEIFVWPFALDVNAEARYVLLRTTSGAGSITCDEWAVLEGDKTAANFNAAYKNPGVKMPLEGLVAQVRVGVLAVAKDLPMAQFIQLTDLRDEKAKKRAARIVLEVPAGIEVCPAANHPLAVTKRPDGGTKVEFSWKNTGKGEPPSVYLKAVKDSIPGKAVLYAVCNDKAQFRSEYPVQVLEFPEFEPFQKLHISLAWIGEAYQRNWPDFFRVWRRLGFNWISAFPMYHKTCPDAEALAFYEAGKKQGFKLVMNLSVLKELSRKGGKKDDVFCKGASRVCPSYRGEEYRKEMQRIADYVAAYKPQAFFDDNEAWTRARIDGMKCPRCQEAWKKSGKSWEDYLLSCGAANAADLKNAVAEGEKRGNCKVELLGSYDRSPIKPLYQIQRFEDMYPASINHSQPSLYIAGRANIVRDTVRFNCRAQKNKAQIPFLTAGTYGEFAPEKMELMVLESFLNGACGITFYKYSTFDTPLDFYCMSKALALLRPYEEFILKSDLAEVSLSNCDLSVSALRSGNEMLILVANYTGAKPETELTLPVESKVTDLVTGKAVPVSGKKLSLSVPSGKFQLLHVK